MQNEMGKGMEKRRNEPREEVKKRKEDTNKGERSRESKKEIKI